MFTPPESSGNDVIALLPDTAPAGNGLGLTPKGPTGLLRALAAASNPGVAARCLPTLDAAAVGATASLFEYDVALALDLDGNPLGD
jgi:hypothetical protein